MSKNHNHHVPNPLHDVMCLSVEELSDRYDLEIDPDGTVWDTCEGKQFDDLQQWAVYMDGVLRLEEQVEEAYASSAFKHKIADEY